MNAPTLTDHINGSVGRDPADDRMNQVRDLLIGDHVRASEDRLAALEAKLRNLETELAQRFAELQQRIETLSRDTTVSRQTAFEDLARGIADLGDKIRIIGR